jgi:hypothetical protein
LQFNRARYYDVTTGRWISQDPIGFDAGDANLYRYVMNNPRRSSDPSGLQDPPFGTREFWDNVKGDPNRPQLRPRSQNTEPWIPESVKRKIPYYESKLIVAGHLRAAYVASDYRLTASAWQRVAASLNSGATMSEALEAAARWRVDASNAHRLHWRGSVLADPLVDLYGAAVRKEWDYPTYQMLKEKNLGRGLTEEQAHLRMINRTPNTTWTKVMKAGKWIGYIGLAIEGTTVAYDVFDANSGDRVKVAFKGTGRLIGSIGGGYGGFIAGAKIGGILCGAVGSVVPGLGTGLGYLIGSAIGGILGGALGSTWLAEKGENFGVMLAPSEEKKLDLRGDIASSTLTGR